MGKAGKRPDCLTVQLATALKTKFNRPVVVHALLGLPNEGIYRQRVERVLIGTTYMPIEWAARVAELLDLDIPATVEAVKTEASTRSKLKLTRPDVDAIRSEIEAALAAYPLDKSVALAASKAPAPTRRASDKTSKAPVNQLDLLRRSN